MIRQLERETVQLLSSSQVITSVHSAVKELVENALDADATSIAVRLENYGLDLIEVRDNGRGVKQEDVAAMVHPHSTSKISSFQNLNSLQTYGFRGEALHSLTTMGCVSVTTRTAGDSLATAYEFTSTGEVGVARACPDEPGTTVSITGLFKTVPVRRQYYKSSRRCKESLKRVEEFLLAFGLAHPTVRFQLRHNSHTLWQKPQVANFEDNAANILGVECFQRLAPLNYQCFDPMVKIKALLPSPRADLSNSTTRATSDRLFVLVNKRPVVLKPVMQLVKQAFSAAFPSASGRYPIAVVLVTVLPQAMDVNLEPNKTTVMLHDLAFITDTLQSLLEQLYSVCKVAPTGIKSGGEKVTKNGKSDEGREECRRLEGFDRTVHHETSSAAERSHQLGGSHMGTSQDLASGLYGNRRAEQDTCSSVRPCGGCGEDPRAAGEGNLQESSSEQPRERCGNGRVRDTVEGTFSPECQSSYSLLDSDIEEEAANHNGCRLLDRNGSDSQLFDSRMNTTLEDPVMLHDDNLVATWTPELQEETDSTLNDVISPELLKEMEQEDIHEEEQRAVETELPDDGGVASDDVAMASGTESGRSLVTHQGTLSQWSRGLSRHLSNHPVQLCLPPNNARTTPPSSVRTPPTSGRTPPIRTPKSKLTQKRPAPVYDIVDSVPVKRQSNSSGALPTASQSTLRTTLISKEPRPLQLPRLCTADSSTEFSLGEVQKRLSSAESNRRSAQMEHNHVVGWCDLSEVEQVKSPGVWLVRCGRSLACFNVKSAQEDLCYVGNVKSKCHVDELLSACGDTGNNSNAYFHIIHELDTEH